MVTRVLISGASQGASVRVLVLPPVGRAALVGGVILGTALWSALALRDLRCWEAANRLTLYTNAAARKLALTRQQALDQMVVVAEGDDVASGAAVTP